MVQEESAGNYLLGLVLPCYGAVSGGCLCLACTRRHRFVRGRFARPDRLGNLDSLAEISVAEPGSFELHLVKR